MGSSTKQQKEDSHCNFLWRSAQRPPSDFSHFILLRGVLSTKQCEAEVRSQSHGASRCRKSVFRVSKRLTVCRSSDLFVSTYCTPYMLCNVRATSPLGVLEICIYYQYLRIQHCPPRRKDNCDIDSVLILYLAEIIDSVRVGSRYSTYREVPAWLKE